MILSCALGAVPSPSVAQEEPEPFLSLEDGFASDHPLLRPGKLDFLYRHLEDAEVYNFIYWTPLLKGGVGHLDAGGARPSTYGGGYLRPLALWPEYGDLIVGANAVRANDDNSHEVQGEYRLPFGLGLGGGFAETPTAFDPVFGKASFRNELFGWKYILSAQVQDVDDEISPGGYAAVYNEQIRGTFGHDGEQWRTSAGYIAPVMELPLRPAVEVLYVDSSVGEFNGPRFLFINGTLSYRGGFLSLPASLGRSMGPQGIEYGNPLGFLRPTWNRRLETWELGGLLDVRAVRTELPNRRSSPSEKYEALVFPFQLRFAERPDLLDGFFLGGFYANRPGHDSPGVLVGYSAPLGFLQFSLAVEVETEEGDTAVVVGLIDKF